MASEVYPGHSVSQASIIVSCASTCRDGRQPFLSIPMVICIFGFKCCTKYRKVCFYVALLRPTQASVRRQKRWHRQQAYLYMMRHGSTLNITNSVVVRSSTKMEYSHYYTPIEMLSMYMELKYLNITAYTMVNILFLLEVICKD